MTDEVEGEIIPVVGMVKGVVDIGCVLGHTASRGWTILIVL